MHTKSRVTHFFIGCSLAAVLFSCSASNSFYHKDLELLGNNSAEILGGTDADVSFAQQNGIVGIYNTSTSSLCTGSLIAKNLVLSAAHCVDAATVKNTIIFFGISLADVAQQFHQGDTSNMRHVLNAVVHEGFGASKINPAVSNNDISIFLFEGEAPAGFIPARVAPLRLLPVLQSNAEATLAGFGVSEYKSDPTTHQPLIHTGAGILRSVGNIKILSVMSTGEEIIFDQFAGKGACHGDSGGPAYYDETATNTRWLIGVTSRDRQGQCQGENVFTGVLGYENWIETTANKLNNRGVL